MAKSRTAKGKEPVGASSAPRSRPVDNNLRDQLARQAQAHQVKNHGRKKLVPDDELDNDASSNEESYLDNESGPDDALEPEDENMSHFEEQSGDEEVSIQEQEEQLRAQWATLQQRKQTAPVATSRSGPSRSHVASVRTTITAPARTPTSASARTTAAAPARTPVAVPARSVVAAPTRAPAPTAAPAIRVPPGHKKPEPLVWEGGQDWIVLPERKVDQTVKKIREGLGAQGDRTGWLRLLATVRDGITRCGLDTSKPWSRQDPTKVGLLLPILQGWIPGFAKFEDNWAALYLVQSRFNNRRGTNLLLEREIHEQGPAANPVAEQPDLDAPVLQRFDTEPELSPEPTPVLMPASRHSVQDHSPRHASTSHRQGAAVPTGVPADRPAPMQPLQLLAPPPTHSSVRTTNIPSTDPVASEKPKGRPRPRMRPPPVNDEPVPDTMRVQSEHSRRTLAGAPDAATADLSADAQATRAKGKGKGKAAAPPLPLEAPMPTGWPDPPVTPRPSPVPQTASIVEAVVRSPQCSPSGGGPSSTWAAAQQTSTSQPPVENPRIEKLHAPKTRREREPAPKKTRTQDGAIGQALAETDPAPPADPPGSSTSGVSGRRLSLRSGKAAAAAAIEQTAAARQNQQPKKRSGLPLKLAPSKKAKGKKSAPPPSSPPSEPLEAESEGPSENDDGFHSSEED